MSDLKCEIQKPSEAELTVGDRFAIHCEGPVPELDLKALELKLDEKDHYSLKLFGVEKTPSGLDLAVTSYRVGAHDLKAVQLLDPENSLVLGDLRFTVASVQNPEQPRDKPYGPMGPLGFFPWLMVILGVSLLIALAIPPILIWLRRRARQKLLAVIDRQPFQYPPFQEFHRVLRQTQRRHLFLADPAISAPAEDLGAALREMEKNFRVYLSRQFRMPALQWPTSRTLQALKRETNLPLEVRQDVAQALQEMEKAQSQVARLAGKDLYQILRLLRKASEGIESHGRKGKV